VRHAAFAHLRRERLSRQWTEAQTLANPDATRVEPPDAAVHASELAAAAERAIAELPERCRLVFTLSRQHGLRYAEIAQVMGITVGTVEVQMNRALKALRTKLTLLLRLLIASTLG
jgi:RNA polymerase sigma-70 factor (ECF subfamily)